MRRSHGWNRSSMAFSSLSGRSNRLASAAFSAFDSVLPSAWLTWMPLGFAAFAVPVIVANAWLLTDTVRLAVTLCGDTTTAMVPSTATVSPAYVSLKWMVSVRLLASDAATVSDTVTVTAGLSRVHVSSIWALG